MPEILFTTSWDDGDPLDVKVADTLSEFGLTGTFYASTGPGGRRTIDDNDLEYVGSQHELGVHGRTHTIWPQLTKDQLIEEITWARDELARFGPVATVVAPPKGKMNRSTVDTAAHLGLRVRSAPIVGSPWVRSPVMEPSFSFYPHRTWTVLRNAARRRVLPSPGLVTRHGLTKEFGERMRSMFDSAAERMSHVHVWGHSGDLEKFGLWEEFRNLLRHVVDHGVTPVTNDGLIERAAEER